MNSAVANIVMLATLCSNPLVIKANKHQNTIISLPDSLFILIEQSTAKQTSRLHKIPFTKSGIKSPFILVAAVLSIKAPVGVAAAFVSDNKSPSNVEPIAFPIKLQTHMLAESFHVTFLSRAPTVSIILFPVKSSEPAMITRLRAIPKESPISIFVKGKLLSEPSPPIVIIRKIPKPT